MSNTGLDIGPYALANKGVLPFLSTLPLSADWAGGVPFFLAEGIAGICIHPLSDVPEVNITIPNTVQGHDSDVIVVTVDAPYVGPIIRAVGDQPVNIRAIGGAASTFASWTHGGTGIGNTGSANLGLMFYTERPPLVPMQRVAFQRYRPSDTLSPNPATTILCISPAFGRKFFYLMAKGAAGIVVTLEGFWLSSTGTASFVTLSQQTIPVGGVIEFTSNNAKRLHGVRLSAAAVGALDSFEYYLGMDDGEGA
jgi:hypothetical protein